MLQVKYLEELTTPFSPLDLSPVLWLDASDTSTITESGGAVSQWDDKSGNGYHLTQGTAAAQPTSGTRTLNGRNVLDFDGTSDSIYRSSVVTTAVDDFGMFVVLAADIVAALRAPVYNGSTSSGWGVAYGATSSTVGYLNAGVAWGTSATTATTGAHIVYYSRNTGTSAVRQDGADLTSVSQNTPTVPTSAFKIGSHTLSSNWFDGVIAEIIVVDGILSAAQIAATESYLAAKWGITI